jgi:N-acetyl-anhydromuramyl-L-alanine amidase AmpD
MRATSIPAHEKGFRNTGKDSSGKQHVLSPFGVTVPGTEEKVAMVRCARENGDDSFYFQEETPKKRIVLHFTAGYLKGDIDTLTKPGNHVSVPFLIARDGTIYNLWPSKYWSYHLGPGAEGGNTEMSKSSIGIELSNIGYLEKKGTNLVTQYSSTDIYCSEDETAFYQKVKPFREHEYFATYTKEQYASLVKLLRYLTAQYKIPREFVAVAERYGTFPKISQFQGITSHVNFRPSGKWDIGPCFEWDAVCAGVQAA